MAMRQLNKLFKGAAHFKNLLALAHADKKLDEEEIKFLNHMANKLEIDDTSIELIKKGKVAETNRLYYPSTAKGKIENLLELILLMRSDGNIHKKEKEICEKVAYQYGLYVDIIDKMMKELDDIIEGRTGKNIRDFESLVDHFYNKLKNDFVNHEKNTKVRSGDKSPFNEWRFMNNL